MVTCDASTPTNPALLLACATAPDDDLPRLVLADWYDENGDATRAQLLRVSITVARCEACKGIGVLFSGFMNQIQAPCTGCHALRKNLHLLECKVAASEIHRMAQMVPPIGKQVKGRRRRKEKVERTPPQLELERGLISRVRCRLSGWLHFGPTLSHHPLIQVVPVDKKPHVFQGGLGNRYYGWRKLPNEPLWEDCWPWEIPAVICEELEPVALFDESGWNGWWSAEDAHHAIGVAMVRWARQQAGTLSAVPFSPEKS